MRIVIISDTHGRHRELKRLEGDVLVHCGDFCDGFMNDGSMLADVDDWFGGLEFDTILCIGGNHDFVPERLHAEGKPVFENAIYLADAAYEVNGVSFYGTPWIPDLKRWAHFKSDEERAEKWRQIPTGIDVLITHTPPQGILDKPRSGKSIGCALLRQAIDRVRPQIHCFGHVHASPGCKSERGTEFINATVVNSEMEVKYAAVIREVTVRPPL